jgi:pimeloyl-ACP methyl ester carboxylesterase
LTGGDLLAALDRAAAAKVTILPASHFAWEEISDQFAALVADWVARAETGSGQ